MRGGVGGKGPLEQTSQSHLWTLSSLSWSSIAFQSNMRLWCAIERVDWRALLRHFHFYPISGSFFLSLLLLQVKLSSLLPRKFVHPWVSHEETRRVPLSYFLGLTEGGVKQSSISALPQAD